MQERGAAGWAGARRVLLHHELGERVVQHALAQPALERAEVRAAAGAQQPLQQRRRRRVTCARGSQVCTPGPVLMLLHRTMQARWHRYEDGMPSSVTAPPSSEVWQWL